MDYCLALQARALCGCEPGIETGSGGSRRGWSRATPHWSKLPSYTKTHSLWGHRSWIRDLLVSVYQQLRPTWVYLSPRLSFSPPVISLRLFSLCLCPFIPAYRMASTNVLGMVVSRGKGENLVSHDWRVVSMTWFAGRPLIESCTAYACEMNRSSVDCVSLPLVNSHRHNQAHCGIPWVTSG